MKFYLVVQSGPLEGKAFPVKGGEIIGREKGDIVLSDPKVSGKHAIVKKTLLGKLYLQDQKSKNGIKVNGRRTDKVTLELGATFQIGANQFEVRDKRPRPSSSKAGPPIKAPSQPSNKSESEPLGPPSLKKMDIAQGSLSSIPGIKHAADEFSRQNKEAPDDHDSIDDSTGPLTDLSQIQEKLTSTDFKRPLITDPSIRADVESQSFEQEENPQELEPALDSSLEFNEEASPNADQNELEDAEPSTQLINDVLADLDPLSEESARPDQQTLKITVQSSNDADGSTKKIEQEMVADEGSTKTIAQEPFDDQSIEKTIVTNPDKNPYLNPDDETPSDASYAPEDSIDEHSLKFNDSVDSSEPSGVETDDLSFSDETVYSPAEEPKSDPSIRIVTSNSQIKPVKPETQDEQIEAAKGPSTKPKDDAVEIDEDETIDAKALAADPDETKKPAPTPAPKPAAEDASLGLDNKGELSLSGLVSEVKSDIVEVSESRAPGGLGEKPKPKEPEFEEPQENSKPGASISLRTLHEKEQFQEHHPQQKEKRQRWNHILEGFSRDCVREIGSQPKKLEPFQNTIKLTFYKGIQAETEWLIGYGPRYVGRKSLDLPLTDDKTPGDISFSFHPQGETAIFRTPFPKEVKVNGKAISEVEVKNGDIITLNQTEIEIEILR